ncbi:TPA: helix-turn-helix transcriptional regulator, partial [Escherichia coli]
STSMNTNRILRKKEVLHLTGNSSATLYRLISKGFFPLSKRLTGDNGRAVGWLESDINNWVNSRMQAGE